MNIRKRCLKQLRGGILTLLADGVVSGPVSVAPCLVLEPAATKAPLRSRVRLNPTGGLQNRLPACGVVFDDYRQGSGFYFANANRTVAFLVIV